MKLPKISVVIPTFNEEENIYQCLESIFMQSYPKDKLEVIVVDNKSEDRTVEIVKKFPVKILSSSVRHGEASKMIGFREAKGELAMYLDADIHLRGKSWLKKMVLPLLEDGSITASFTRYYSDKHSKPIERYLNLDPLQRDAIYQFFSPSIDSTIIEKISTYYVCRYGKNKIPPAGLCLYRKEELLEQVREYNMFLELDFLVILVKNGFNKFAYVPQAGLFHHHAKSLFELVKKRWRNVRTVYLKDNQARKYRWFKLTSLSGILRVAFWIIYANLLLPSTVTGLYKAIKYKNLIALYEPLINFLVTNMLLIAFLSDTRTIKLFLRK